MAKRPHPRLDFTHMQPYLLQREILDHPAKFKVVAFGRQSGKSWLARRWLLEEAANKGMRCWWIAPTIPTARPHWAELVRLIEEVGFPVKNINKSEKMIEFFSGGYIQIRSAEIPDNLRGGTLDRVVIDEAAFMSEYVWYGVLQPTITASGGQVLFLSTPNGRNWFHKLFLLGQNEDYPLFKSWTMPSTSAPYQNKELLEIIRQTVPEAVWREEYLAEFLADSGGVFAGLDRIAFQPPLLKPVPGHVYVAGVDWGMDDDYTVFTVADKYEKRQVYGERFNSIGTIEQVDRIIELLNIWQPEVANIEMNGVGKPLFQLLRQRYKKSTDFHSPDQWEYVGVGGKTRIRGIYMNNAKKRQIIERYAAAIEWQRFTPLVAEHDADTTSFGAIQVAEMSTFQRKRTAAGLEITYGAAEGYHDDTVMAGALMFAGLGEYILLSNDEGHEPNERKEKQQRASLQRSTKRSPFQTSFRKPRESGRESTRRHRRRSL